MNRNGNNPDPIPSALNTRAVTPLATGPATDPTIDAAIGAALGRKPSIAIPEGFAARVAHRAAAQPQPRPARWVGWGPRLTIVSGALLTAAMFALAPHAVPSLSSVRFDAELILLAELSGLLLFSNRLLSRD